MMEVARKLRRLDRPKQRPRLVPVVAVRPESSGPDRLTLFPDMVIEEPEFRRVLGHWPTGVAVVTARTRDGSPRGLTANAITSVSLDPLLVLVCVALDAETHAAIEATAGFAINMLPAAGERLARRFADDGREDKFDGLGHRTEVTGAPILEDALGWLDCRLRAAHAGGDHTIFVGEVLAGDARDGEPLLFYRGGYGRPVR